MSLHSPGSPSSGDTPAPRVRGQHSLARLSPWHLGELSASPSCFATDPDSQFSEGQANRQDQGLPGLAKRSQFSGFGDFEPAAVAGVAGLAERSPPTTGKVASQLLEGVGWLCWPLAQAAEPAEGGLGWGLQEGLTPHVAHHHPLPERVGNPAPPGPKAGQGSWPDLGLGLKAHVLSPTWEILAINWGGSTARTSPSLNLQVSAGAGHPMLLCQSTCELLAPPSGKYLLCSQCFTG